MILVPPSPGSRRRRSALLVLAVAASLGACADLSGLVGPPMSGDDASVASDAESGPADGGPATVDSGVFDPLSEGGPLGDGAGTADAPPSDGGGLDARSSDAPVDVGPPDVSVDAPTDAASDAAPLPIVNITIGAATVDFDLAAATGVKAAPAEIRVTLAAVVSASSAATPAFTTGNLPAGSRVVLTHVGAIFGAGGAGGSGGNGASGGNPLPCGRPGQRGGTALRLTVPTTIVGAGIIYGGGGGGGGYSGCLASAGGGGGAGSVGGPGGAAATTLTAQEEINYCGQDNGVRNGVPGQPGGTSPGTGGTGGTAGVCSGVGGTGGAYGSPGTGATGTGATSVGGAAGYAIQKNGHACNVADGAPTTGAIRGIVAN